MNYQDNEADPIVSTLLRRGLIPNEAEALQLIDRSEARVKGDAAWAFAGAAAGIASSCGILALSGATAPIVVPIGALISCLISAWNSRQTEIDRNQEAEFIAEYPQLMALIDHADSQGMPSNRIAAAYEQAFKAWRYGDFDAIKRYLPACGQALPDDPQTQARQGFAPSNQALPDDPQTFVATPPLAHPQTQSGQGLGYVATPPLAHPQTQSGQGLGYVATPPLAHPKNSRSLFTTLADNPFLCYFILATQRTGKTTSAAAASLAVKREHGTRIFYLNLADHNQGNREAFAHADGVVIGDINGGDPAVRRQLIADAIAMINEFHGGNNDILIVDEFVGLGSKGRPELDDLWATLYPKADALTSNGVGCGRSVWAIGPRFQAGSIREEAKVAKNFIPVILSVAPGQSIEWANPASGAKSQIPYNGALVGQAQKNWPEAGIVEPSMDEANYWQQIGASRVFWADGYWSVLDKPPAIATPTPVNTPAPSVDSITHVGRTLAAQLKAQGDSTLLLRQQVEAHRSSGRIVEALALMIRHCCPTKAAFVAMVGPGHDFVFDNAMGMGVLRSLTPG